MPRSLGARLMLAALLAMLAASAAAAALLRWSTSSPSLFAAELADQVEHVADGLRVDGAGAVSVQFGGRIGNAYDGLGKDTAFVVRDRAGREVARSPDGPALQALRGLPAQAASYQVANPSGPIRLGVADATVERAGQRYLIRVARSDRMIATLSSYEDRLYLRAALLTLGGALLVFHAVVFLTVRRTLRPLREVSAAAAQIRPRNLSARLREDGLPDELRPLIHAFNAALARLEDGFRVQQEFLGAAAHELKTPLALLRAEIELGGAADRALLLRDTDLMARQVHQLLHLAEVSEGRNYRFTPLDLHAAATDVLGYLQRLADRAGVALRLCADAPTPTVEADAGALFVLLKNLLENAVSHSPAGAAVTLRLGADGFSVSDQGPGVAAADRARLFERFWRADPAGGGAGLGLAICREIALAHGWTLALDDAGGGACFRVRFDTPGALRADTAAPA
jgi:signal transduction histidine kinase